LGLFRNRKSKRVQVAATSPLMDRIHETMLGLGTSRPVFHSEADFQHALAWQIRHDHPDAEVRLETRPLPDEALFLDVLVRLAGVKIAIECKYFTKALDTRVAGESFNLRNQGANPIRRYDAVKDITRLERLVDAGAVDEGLGIVLANDPAYWQPASGGETIDHAFRIHEGRQLEGYLAWDPGTGAGTSQGREDPVVLRGSYRLQWQDFSTPAGGPGGSFRYLVVNV